MSENTKQDHFKRIIFTDSSKIQNQAIFSFLHDGLKSLQAPNHKSLLNLEIAI